MLTGRIAVDSMNLFQVELDEERRLWIEGMNKTNEGEGQNKRRKNWKIEKGRKKILDQILILFRFRKEEKKI